MGAAHPRDRVGGAGDPRAHEQLLRQLRDDERSRDRRPAGIRGPAAGLLSRYPEPVGKARALIGPLLGIMLAACTLPPLETPTPSPTTTATPAPSPTPTATPTRAPTPSPTPVAVIPEFEAGEIVATAIDGLRVHSLPGVQRPVITGLLP